MNDASGLNSALKTVNGPAKFGRSNMDNPQPIKSRMKKTAFSFLEYFFIFFHCVKMRMVIKIVAPKNASHLTISSPHLAAMLQAC